MPHATARLYYDDAYLLTFAASVVDVRTGDAGLAVALDRSAFYPTSGGQAHDLGQLTPQGGAPMAVRDVIDEGDLVWHVLVSTEAAGWTAGLAVHGEVHGARRADHRQQHSGQHVLSASFAHVCGAETRSVHLGADLCTLDLDRELSADELAAAEDDANRVVLENRPVRVRHVDGAEAATLPLRRPTSRAGTVRLVEIGGHDLSACGGTHVARTGEIGAILVRATERFKGGLRVTFVCGQRAVATHRALVQQVDAAARALSVPPPDLAHAVSRLLEDGRETRRALDAALVRVGALEAEALASQFASVGTAQVLVAQIDGDADALKRLAGALVASPNRLVVLTGTSSPHALVVARSDDLTDVDAGALARELARGHGGKAGGRPVFAQGGGLTSWHEDEVRAQVATALGVGAS